MSEHSNKFRFSKEVTLGDLVLSMTTAVGFTVWLMHLEAKVDRHEDKLSQVTISQQELRDNYRVAQEGLQSVQKTQAILATLLEERTKKSN